MLQSKPVSSNNNSNNNGNENHSSMTSLTPLKGGGVGVTTSSSPGSVTDGVGDNAGSFWAGNSKDTIRAIQTRAHSISAAFAKLCR